MACREGESRVEPGILRGGQADPAQLVQRAHLLLGRGVAAGSRWTRKAW